MDLDAEFIRIKKRLEALEQGAPAGVSFPTTGIDNAIKSVIDLVTALRDEIQPMLDEWRAHSAKAATEVYETQATDGANQGG